MRVFSTGPRGDEHHIRIQRAAMLRFLSLASATRKSYLSGQRRYILFCRIIKVPPLPLSEQTLSLWLADMSYKLSYSTISQYLYSVRNLSIEFGFGNPVDSFPELSRVKRGFGRFLGRTRKRPRLPITVQLLRSFGTSIGSSLDEQVSWTIITTGVFGLFRLAELAPRSQDDRTSLTLSSIASGESKGTKFFSIHLRFSKTDQSGTGHHVIVSESGGLVCAFTEMQKYLRMRNRAMGPLNPHQYLFCFSNGLQVLYKDICSVIKTLAKINKLPQNVYYGHSLRKGGVMSLIAVNTPDKMIMRLGRWKSAAYLRYVDQPNTDMINLATRLAQE